MIPDRVHTLDEAIALTVQLAGIVGRLEGAIEWVGQDFLDDLARRLKAGAELGALNLEAPTVKRLLEGLPRLVANLEGTAEMLGELAATFTDDLIPALKRTAEAIPRPD